MSKHNIKSVVEHTEEDDEKILDEEFKKNLEKEMNEFNKSCEYDRKCINICADIRTYLDKNYCYKICNKLDVDTIKLYLSEIYS